MPMTSVQSALNDMFSSFELTERERSNASEQQARVREALRSALTLQQDFLTGSYQRRTAIRPLHDIDLFVVLEPTAHGPLRHAAPTDALRLVQAALDRAWPNKEHPLIQTRSVNIEFAGTGIGYDVVPAFAQGEHYMIPDRATNRWITSNPRIHANLSTEANQRANQLLKPAFKALKHWREGHGRLGRSFHLEVLSWRAFDTPPTTRLDALVDLFASLEESVMAPCPDPAGLGPPIDAGQDPARRATLHERLIEATNQLRTAKRYSDDGHTAFAHHALRGLFKSAYPERGEDPAHRTAAPAVVTAAGGLDGGGSRWG